MNIWMKVSKDEYRLPQAIADSAQELAELCGTNENSVRSTASKHRRGQYKTASYIKVEVEDGD